MTEIAKPSFPAKVLDVVDPGRVAFNRGARDGIKKGQRFLVYALGKELTDPDTGESLGQLEVVRGTGVAVHVQDRVTTIESDMRGPHQRRTVRRSDAYAVLMGRGEEIVEETGTLMPFDGPKIGDLVKPL